MKNITLIPIDDALIAALDEGPSAFAARFGGSVDHVLGLAREVAGMVASKVGIPRGTPTWGGYLTLDPESRMVIGTCAFKGAPREGAVEIAYFTFPDYEGQGYASSMAAALIDTAWMSPEITSVTARTLPERNASCRVLERVGMAFDGDVIDPEDGPVWQWRIVRPAIV